MDEKAPRSIHSANQPLVELGSWQIITSGKSPVVTFYPWIAVEAIPTPVRLFKPKRDRLALARHYQALLDNGTASNQAELARYLGVSRARVSQVLRRLKQDGSTGSEKAG